jgi:hypothetical protein
VPQVLPRVGTRQSDLNFAESQHSAKFRSLRREPALGEPGRLCLVPTLGEVGRLRLEPALGEIGRLRLVPALGELC